MRALSGVEIVSQVGMSKTVFGKGFMVLFSPPLSFPPPFVDPQSLSSDTFCFIFRYFFGVSGPVGRLATHSACDLASREQNSKRNGLRLGNRN